MDDSPPKESVYHNAPFLVPHTRVRLHLVSAPGTTVVSQQYLPEVQRTCGGVRCNAPLRCIAPFRLDVAVVETIIGCWRASALACGPAGCGLARSHCTPRDGVSVAGREVCVCPASKTWSESHRRPSAAGRRGWVCTSSPTPTLALQDPLARRHPVGACVPQADSAQCLQSWVSIQPCGPTLRQAQGGARPAGARLAAGADGRGMMRGLALRQPRRA
jgi:hypothetical protein